MNQFKVGDRVICNNCNGEIVELLEAIENPQDQLYLVWFGEAGNYRLRDSELVQPTAS